MKTNKQMSIFKLVDEHEKNPAPKTPNPYSFFKWTGIPFDPGFRKFLDDLNSRMESHARSCENAVPGASAKGKI